MNCVNCKKNNIAIVDKYKMEIDQDVKYLGEMSIFKCNEWHVHSFKNTRCLRSLLQKKS